MQKTSSFYPIILIFIALLITSCTPGPSEKQDETTPATKTSASSSAGVNQQWKDYWYQGKAEITSYQLEQARYGATHTGDAVLVFVTEPFSKSKQVKLDNPSAANDDAVSVLKMNFTKKFVTGIYPYSIMQSVFTPVEYGRYSNTLKVTTSSQEWCGHTFLQLNLQPDSYRYRGYSYFESEGDVDKKIDRVLLEDELWNMLRFNPDDLPTGEVQLIPNTVYARLAHQPVQGETALLKKESSENASTAQFIVDYQSIDRRLSITYQKDFPYQITGWKESYATYNGKQAVTTATKKKTLFTPYWTQNNPADTVLRKELMLD